MRLSLRHGVYRTVLGGVLMETLNPLQAKQGKRRRSKSAVPTKFANLKVVILGI
jgi:hypothetical protein